MIAFMLRALAVAAATALAALPPGSASAQQTSLGPLDGYVPTDSFEAPWRYSTSGGAVTIGNETEDGAVTYFWYKADGLKDRTVAADLYIDPASDPSGFGGLVFNFDTEAKTYAMVALHADGSVGLYIRDAQGMTMPISSTLEAPPQGWAHVEVKEAGDEVSWFVNGERIGSMSRPGFGQGAVGIAAGRKVFASFANFKVTGTETPGN